MNVNPFHSTKKTYNTDSVLAIDHEIPHLVDTTYTIYVYKDNLALQTYENEDILGILECWSWVIWSQQHGFVSHAVYNIVDTLLFLQ